jgi:hypothetical protein
VLGCTRGQLQNASPKSLTDIRSPCGPTQATRLEGDQRAMKKTMIGMVGRATRSIGMVRTPLC